MPMDSSVSMAVFQDMVSLPSRRFSSHGFITAYVSPVLSLIFSTSAVSDLCHQSRVALESATRFRITGAALLPSEYTMVMARSSSCGPPYDRNSCDT